MAITIAAIAAIAATAGHCWPSTPSPAIAAVAAIIAIAAVIALAGHCCHYCHCCPSSPSPPLPPSEPIHQEQLHAIRLQRERDERQRQISVVRLQEGGPSLSPRTAPALDPASREQKRPARATCRTLPLLATSGPGVGTPTPPSQPILKDEHDGLGKKMPGTQGVKCYPKMEKQKTKSGPVSWKNWIAGHPKHLPAEYTYGSSSPPPGAEQSHRAMYAADKLTAMREMSHQFAETGHGDLGTAETGHGDLGTTPGRRMDRLHLVDLPGRDIPGAFRVVVSVLAPSKKL